jgi:ribonuclease BN (tRNA processing enzyme)
MKIIPLGTNGFFPSFGRQTACYAIPYGDILIILDAGSGFFRLVEPIGQKLLKNTKEVHLFLSHYHLDHTFGFYGAFELLKGKKVKVFAQSKRLVFSEFVILNHFPIDYSKMHKNFSWHILDQGQNDMGKYKVYTRNQNHRGEVSLAFRFDFGLAYLTDGEITNENTEFLKQVPLLLHEHWFTGQGEDGSRLDERQIMDGHVTSVGSASVAKAAAVGKLALIHHMPFDDALKLNKKLDIAKKIFPETILAMDLKEISF